MVKIDQDEMQGGQDVASALRAGKGGGIPWFVFLDASEPVLAQNASGDLARRDEAVLATADAPAGNVGCPVTRSERAHFVSTIEAARMRMTDGDIDRFAELLQDYARELIGDEADEG